jgi:hypothetical protein
VALASLLINAVSNQERPELAKSDPENAPATSSETAPIIV